MNSFTSYVLILMIICLSGSRSDLVAQDFDPANIALEANKAKVENRPTSNCKTI